MRRMLSALLAAVLLHLLVAAPLIQTQEPAQNQTPSASLLTNKDVMDMVKSGLATDVIIAKIKSSASKFDTAPSALAELKTAGVPDPVVLAMVQSTGLATPNSPSTVSPGVETTVKVPDGTEIEIQLKNTLSGEEAKVGDVVDFMIVARST